MPTKEFQDTVQHFSSFLLDKGRKPSTIKRYAYDIEDFGQWLQESKRHLLHNIWTTLHTEDYEEYFNVLKKQRNYSDKTIHRVYIVLSRLYQYLDLPNPMEDMNLIVQPNRALRDEDFISKTEEKRLKHILTSLEGLTEKQRSVRPLLMDRNIAVVHLLINNGLSLQELVGLQMKNVHFENNTISVPGILGIKKTILLTEDDKKILFNYYKTIPKPVRPKYHSNDPLFVAFDFTRKTYHWSYDNDAPKALTEIAVQKMIRLEVERANLRKGISAQHLRNTFILRLIENEVLEGEIIKQIGFRSKLSLKRYYDYIN
ncbi:phage integrase N-terminal SAM-like domain-containing protein [Bacillus cereus]|uniref:Phage integrase N-terminal SAM-like domain-containing protein n=1 Tax=Bacillus cereus TaxID=1396 RepID=A0ABD7DP54_BACCE|nr:MULTISPECIES: site-specific integrase [Bacillus cereus group]MCU4937253.1 phage integrase N-terminal SAM-like domain-containing protein [Bacillus cereus]MCU5506683.1 phage integrase N-terminal SAM-like domain-containing protein [Bacillus cereus]MCU5622968.1 phage integrase N-terminal SAM-like domain-containing protein [Bacillus cereus]MCU5678843.1 phage integrase N-terminal SAM-like domain-containing protein [Bacillus cereus]MDA2101898.1 phage integrase N-terminal SAM-like domain-containing